MRISDWSSDVCSSDLFRISAAVLQLELHLRRATTARYVTGKQLLAQAQHIGARLLDVHEDRIQPLDRGERVGLRSGDERADGVCRARSEEHTSELQSLMRISYAVFCLKKTILNE